MQPEFVSEQELNELPPFKDAGDEAEIKDDTSGSEDEAADSADMGPSVEIEYLRKKRSFVHQISFGVFRTDVEGHSNSRFLRRFKYKIVCMGLCLLLIILPAVIIPKRKKKTANSVSSVSSGSAPGAFEGEDLDEALGGDGDNGNGGSGNGNGDDGTGSTVFETYRDPGTYTPITFSPFSDLDPVADLDLPNFVRPADSSPSSRLDPLRVANLKRSIPTNAWYQNLLLLRDNQAPTNDHRAYTMPYIVDVTGPIPGLRVHTTTVETTTNQVIVSVQEPMAVTLGAAEDISSLQQMDTSGDKGYSVLAATDLAITLQWTFADMKSSLVRGMPYATMTYPSFSKDDIIRPTIYSEMGIASMPLVDESRTADCGMESSFEVKHDIELSLSSGKTWLAFFSQPVTIQCKEMSEGGPFALQVLDIIGGNSRPLVVRLALVVPSSEDLSPTDYESDYKYLLRTRSNLYPGERTSVRYAMDNSDAALIFDWDAQSMSGDSADDPAQNMISYAMPHHQDKLNEWGQFCTSVLLGSVCLVEGTTWTIAENLPAISFRAPRRPDPSMLPDLAEAVASELKYRVPNNYFIGAGDTYFSGKALGKLSRIILIAQEILDICAPQQRSRRLRSLVSDEYTSACDQITLPSQTAIASALDHLRQATEIWINGNAQAPFLFDPAWGGVVNCGCDYSNGNCQNSFPNCPGLTDQGLNFGLGFYNDHHFHYGYHIYAAAVLASFDGEWGKTNFEKVLLLVRDIANPSEEDHLFPLVRHKDWYHGSSWASGISQPPSPTGMNQESSSEAIAGYEAVALFGKTMYSVFQESSDGVKMAISDEVYKMGRLLTATELRSTKRYWQVTHQIESRKIFEPEYKPNCVGILWSSKAFFGTWFGNSPYLMYGIQLLPLTPISEERDDIDWAREMFDVYAQSCDGACVAEGWSVQIIAILATLGQKQKASEHAKDLTKAIFESPGGNGHSKSNTLWYIATRPQVAEPYSLTNSYQWEDGPTKLTCFQPNSCTDTILDSMAGQYDCRSRISFLMNSAGNSEYDACYQIAVDEFPEVCGLCSPLGGVVAPDDEEELVPIEIEETLPGAIAPPDGLTCNQPTTCTNAVLRAAAGAFPCGDRIGWLIDSKGLSELEACKVIAVNEFPNVCGGCNPAGA